MPIPKTNLFKGDRVMLSRRGLNFMMNCDLYSRKTIEKFRTIRGTIACDTLNPKFDLIVVKWDGMELSKWHVEYLPEELILAEEDDVPHRKAHTRKPGRPPGRPTLSSQSPKLHVFGVDPAYGGDSAGT